MHELKGVIIRLRNEWYNVVANLPIKHINNKPDMELVALSRETLKESFTIWYDDVSGVTVEDLKFICCSKDYDDCKSLEKLLWGQEEKTQAYLSTQMLELDHNCTTPTFEGGFQCLIQ